MIYAATISSTPLMLRETRIVADLLLQGVSDEQWREAVVDKNVLQIDSAIGARRKGNIMRARLEPLGEGLWQMVRDGDRPMATQAALAGAIKHSRLLGDFMDLTIREQRNLFAKKIENWMWTEYIAGCRGRDPEMPHWSDTTIAKLRSVVLLMLAEAEYINDTRSRMLQSVYIDTQLAGYLSDRGESYVLRCLQVME